MFCVHITPILDGIVGTEPFFSVVLADVWAVEDILPASVSPHVTYDSGKREIKLLLKSFRPPEMGEENIRF
jgi:hypothetical protein